MQWKHGTYTLITTVDGLEQALDVVGTDPAALDFETSSFTPDTGRVRLAQICNDNGWYVIDFYAIGRELGVGKEGFRELAHWFDEGAWIVFNAGFEQRWFMDATDEPITCWDVANLIKAIEGGGHFSLAKRVLWDLEYEMDKEQQASNWDQEPLTDEQMTYAGDDALYTWQLWQHWRAQADADHMQAFNMLNDLVVPVIEMETHGLVLDPVRHQTLIDSWTELMDDRVEHIREYITTAEVPNLNSGKQLSDFFMQVLPDELIDAWPKTEKTGLLSTANKDLKQIGAALFGGTPFQDALSTLAEYKTLQKYISSFGDSLITKADMHPESRVEARYNIAAAKTGRFSSSGPNLQQIPRDRDFFGDYMSVRQSFIAPEGRQLVSLDYSGIELRVLALLTGDDQLLEDMVTGDVHLEVGSYMAGRRLDKKIREDKDIRSQAKGVSFGIIYGSSALGLSATLKSTLGRAQELMDFWEDRYPKAFQLRNAAMQDAQDNDGYLRVIDGGTIWMGKPSKVSITQCANYPVQRAALSVMAHAIIRHHESVLDAREAGHDIFMASTIHDALIDETSDEAAPLALQLMKQDMIAGYLDVFPDAPIERLVEGGAGPSWGLLEDVEV